MTFFVYVVMKRAEKKTRKYKQYRTKIFEKKHSKKIILTKIFEQKYSNKKIEKH